jgi:hypothetical protein
LNPRRVERKTKSSGDHLSAERLACYKSKNISPRFHDPGQIMNLSTPAQLAKTGSSQSATFSAPQKPGVSQALGKAFAIK